ncbi:MAG: alpha/beta hydrolase [Myxococcales bacterium]|nr:alpha/beta hydrolase [Myxococcales bacterium]
MIESNSTPHEIWFQRAGTRLFAVEQGHGHPVVFLHGGLADHRASLLRTRELVASYRLITPDVRGAGRSVDAGPLHWSALADDVPALLDHLGLQRAVVGGISAGSAVALAAALRHPERLDALLLVSPVYPGPQRGLHPAPQAAMERMDEVGQRVLVEGIDAILPLFMALPPPIRDAAVEMARGFDPASVAATTRLLASGEQPMASLAELGTLAMPVLIVPGSDPEHPVEVAQLYAQVIPGAAVGEPDTALGKPGAPLSRTIDAFLRAVLPDRAER